ncbi:hypothetical protein ACHAQJ_005152 [Trichoderma viride]
MGTSAGAGVAASFRSSYSSLKLAFLVEICGGVPGVGQDEALLGDVVISKTVIQYSLGRQYPNASVTKDTMGNSLSRPNKDPRTRGIDTTISILVRLKDKLFTVTYRRRHREPQTCNCDEETDSFCDETAWAFCAELHCGEGQLVPRKRLEMKKNLGPDDAQCPEIFIGCVARKVSSDGSDTTKPRTLIPAPLNI